MKSASNQKRRWRKILFPLLAAIIVFSTTTPGLAMAIGGGETQVNIKTKVGPDNKIITEHKINAAATRIEVELTLTDETWASDVLEKEQLILDGMNADIEASIWDEYKKGITINDNDSGDIADSTRKTLTLVLPIDSTYKISGNQKITITLSHLA